MLTLLAASLLSPPSSVERFGLRFRPKVGSRYAETQTNAMTLYDESKPEGERIVGRATLTSVVGTRVLAQTAEATTLRGFIASVSDEGEARGFVANARAFAGTTSELRITPRNMGLADTPTRGMAGARIPFNSGPVGVGDSWEGSIGSVPPVPIRVTFRALLTSGGRRYAILGLTPTKKSEVGPIRFDAGGDALGDSLGAGCDLLAAGRI